MPGLDLRDSLLALGQQRSHARVARIASCRFTRGGECLFGVLGAPGRLIRLRQMREQRDDIRAVVTDIFARACERLFEQRHGFARSWASPLIPWRDSISHWIRRLALLWKLCRK